jgi:hypothetical protein
MELADAVAAMDMDAIRAAVEPERYRYILGVQLEDDSAAAIIALTREIDKLCARVAFLERAGHDAAQEARVAHSQITDALAWYGMNKSDLHPAIAADLFGILTGRAGVVIP